MMLRSALPTLLVAVAIFIAARATADRGHHKPPKEAFSACESHGEGDACQVTFGEHTLSGVCRKAPDGETAALACLPDHPPGPPQAAIDACQGKASGDTCGLTDPDGAAIGGTCRNRHDGNGPLACAPARPRSSRP
jgi:hypothetical protein